MGIMVIWKSIELNCHTLKGNHLSWLDLTEWLTKYHWVFFMCFKPDYTNSFTVYVRIRAAPKCAAFYIKMLWCEDRDECYNISHLDEVTQVPKRYFWNVLGPCSPSSHPSLPIKTRTAFWLPFSPKQGNFIEKSRSVHKHMLTWLHIVWHFCSIHQHGGERTDECVFTVSDVCRPKPANTALGDCVISALKLILTVTFYFSKVLNS